MAYEPRSLLVYYKGEEAGKLNRDKNGVYFFTKGEKEFPFMNFSLSIRQPSESLYSLFETILSQGGRKEALIARCESEDPLDHLLLVKNHPVFSFGTEPLPTATQPFPSVSFDTILETPLDIPLTMIKNQTSRACKDLSVFSGFQDKLIVTVAPEHIRIPLPGEQGNAIMKTALPGSMHSEFESFILNEHLFTALASRVGIQSAETCVLRYFLDNGAEQYSLLSRRFDIDTDTGQKHMVVEAPALLEKGVSEKEKYDYRIQELFDHTVKLAKTNSEHIVQSMAEAVFYSFVVGNSDMHLKNFSFYIDEDNKISLAPLYDVGNSSVYGMERASLAFQHEGLYAIRPGLNSLDGINAVCDFTWQYISSQRMREIAEGVLDQVNEMALLLPFSDAFREKLVNDITKRVHLVFNDFKFQYTSRQ